MSIKAKNTVNKHSNELTAIAKCILKKTKYQNYYEFYV